jgi:hypothetical protein
MQLEKGKKEILRLLLYGNRKTFSRNRCISRLYLLQQNLLQYL